MPKGDRDFEEHVRSRTVTPPAILYKYTTAETARLILSSGKIRFQSPLRYNDPFDSQWDTLWPISTPDARTRKWSLLERAIRDPNSWPSNSDPRFRSAMDRVRAEITALPEDQRKAKIDKLILDVLKDEGLPERVVRQYRDMQRRMRVLCLCESDRPTLMWSHYAGQHRGVVIGFDVAAMENGWRRPVEPVKYAAGPPRLIDVEAWIHAEVFGCPHPCLDGDEREWALTKHTGWQYEHEWRFVWIDRPGTLGDYEDCPFPQNALMEIVSGCRNDLNQSKELFALALAMNPGVRQYRMSEHPSRFELVKSEVTCI